MSGRETTAEATTAPYHEKMRVIPKTSNRNFPINPFFPKTAFNLIEQKAQQVATVMSTWEGSGGFTGESEKPEYRLLYRDVNPLEMQTEAFEVIARGIFGRLFAARTKLH